MTATAWTVRDSNGQLLADFAGGSRLDVGRKLVPGHYDAFRLHVSPPTASCLTAPCRRSWSGRAGKSCGIGRQQIA